MSNNNNSMIEVYKKIIQSSMDKISMNVKLILVSYVQCLYEIRLASAIAILGVDSPETKEALKNSDKKSKESILELAKEMSEKKHIRITQEVDSILSCYENYCDKEHKDIFDNEYKSIKENLLFVGPDEAQKLINNFRNELPVLQNKLNNCIFNFEDIRYLNDRAIQILLNELDQQQLAKALKGASTEVQDRIFRNMSKTAANMLKEDLQFIGPLSLSEVHEAQSFILKTLFDLEKKGKLKINSLQPSQLIK